MSHLSLDPSCLPLLPSFFGIGSFSQNFLGFHLYVTLTSYAIVLVCASGFASSVLSLACCPIYNYFGMSEVISSITLWTTCFECVCVCLFKHLCACCCCSGNEIYCIGKFGSSKESQISSFSSMSWSQHLRQATKTFVLFCSGYFFFYL